MQDLLKKIEAAASARLLFSPHATPAEKLARYKTFLKVEAQRLKMLHRAGAIDWIRSSRSGRELIFFAEMIVFIFKRS